MADRAKSWLSLGANVGVVVGLILVGLQMKQNQELLRVQIMNQFYDSYIAADTSIAGEDVPRIWQKALEDPQNLTIAEMRAMESQTFAPLSRWINLYRLDEAGIVDETVWKSQVRLDAGFYFGHPYGRAWWEYYSERFGEEYLPVELKDHINEKLKTVLQDYILSQYRDIRQIIKENMSSSPTDE